MSADTEIVVVREEPGMHPGAKVGIAIGLGVLLWLMIRWGTEKGFGGGAGSLPSTLDKQPLRFNLGQDHLHWLMDGTKKVQSFTLQGAIDRVKAGGQLKVTYLFTGGAARQDVVDTIAAYQLAGIQVLRAERSLSSFYRQGSATQ